MGKRWKATVIYRAEGGAGGQGFWGGGNGGNGNRARATVDVEHDIEQLGDLAPLIERGPDWNTIIEIKIVLARRTSPGLTIEQDQAGRP